MLDAFDQPAVDQDPIGVDPTLGQPSPIATPAPASTGRSTLLQLFPSKKQAKLLARTSTATIPSTDGTKGRPFDDYLMNLRSAFESKGIPDFTKRWVIQPLHLPLDAHPSATTFTLNLDGHPLNGQTFPMDEFNAYNKWIKKNISLDKAIVGESLRARPTTTATDTGITDMGASGPQTPVPPSTTAASRVHAHRH